jgi:hypothetical protein
VRPGSSEPAAHGAADGTQRLAPAAADHEDGRRARSGRGRIRPGSSLVRHELASLVLAARFRDDFGIPSKRLL